MSTSAFFKILKLGKYNLLWKAPQLLHYDIIILNKIYPNAESENNVHYYFLCEIMEGSR